MSDGNEEFDPTKPPNPDRWWQARRNHANWAAAALILTLGIFTLLCFNVTADVVSASAPVFYTVIGAQTLIIISYIVSASYLDKVTKPFSKIAGMN